MAFSKNETLVWSMVYLSAVKVSIQYFPIINFKGYNWEHYNQQDFNAFFEEMKQESDIFYGLWFMVRILSM